MRYLLLALLLAGCATTQEHKPMPYNPKKEYNTGTRIDDPDYRDRKGIAFCDERVKDVDGFRTIRCYDIHGNQT